MQPDPSGDPTEENEALPVDAVLENRYRIESVLGSGGVGVVYRAEHLALRRPVAVKVLRRAYVEHASLRPRFEREARAVAALSHPNVVAVKDFGVAPEGPFLVMELLRGHTLRERMDLGPMDEEEAFAIIRQVLRGLGYAHSSGLVHRDVKPGNVFLHSLDQQGELVKLLDFGFAKLTDASGSVSDSLVSSVDEAFGTPAYMSPEQATGGAVDGRADIYSVGIVLFEMLAGKKPYDGELTEVIHKHLTAPVPSIDAFLPGVRTSPELTALIARALAKSPQERFRDATEMSEAIDALPRPALSHFGDDLGGRPTRSEPPPAARGVGRGPSSSRPPPARDSSSAARTIVDGRPPVAKPGPPIFGRAFLVAVLVGISVAAVVAWKSRPDSATLRVGGAEPPAGSGTDTDTDTESATDTDTESATESATDTDTESATESESESEPVPEPVPVPVPVAVPDPGAGAGAGIVQTDRWRAYPRVPLLERTRRALNSSGAWDDRTINALRAYAQGNRDDPRPHLLMGRMYSARGWRRDALERYTLAYQLDPEIRHDAAMRSDMVRAVLDGATGNRALGDTVRMYGSEAIPEVDLVLTDPMLDERARVRLQTLRDRLERAPN